MKYLILTYLLMSLVKAEENKKYVKTDVYTPLLVMTISQTVISIVLITLISIIIYYIWCTKKKINPLYIDICEK